MITNPSLPLRGKTLPINFTQSWVQAYFNVLWASKGLGTWGIAFREWSASWINLPLHPYYKNNSAQFEPVDYWFFEQTRRGLNDYLGELAASQYSGKIGFEWWYYLNDEIGHSILPPYKYENLWTESICEFTPQQLREARLRLAVVNFAKNMERGGGILSEVEEIDRGVQLSFPQCPFCANQLAECNMLFGVVQGMLFHLFGIQPILKAGLKEELIFKTALDPTRKVHYHLVNNDSHLIQLKFV
jgi:hypothetical protein